MAEVRCVDGTVLGVHPVPVVDRHDVPYELTLRLTRDAAPFGDVGERCGWFVASTAARLRAAMAEGSSSAARWSSPDDRFPMSSIEGGLRAWAADEDLDVEATWTALERYLPRDRDLFAFRHRDPDDLASAGELRCSVQTERSWEGGDGVMGGGGHWRIACRAVLEAWGDGGVGVRAVLTAPQLATFLADLLAEAAALGCSYDTEQEDDVVVRRPAG